MDCCIREDTVVVCENQGIRAYLRNEVQGTKGTKVWGSSSFNNQFIITINEQRGYS